MSKILIIGLLFFGLILFVFAQNQLDSKVGKRGLSPSEFSREEIKRKTKRGVKNFWERLRQTIEEKGLVPPTRPGSLRETIKFFLGIATEKPKQQNENRGPFQEEVQQTQIIKGQLSCDEDKERALLFAKARYESAVRDAKKQCDEVLVKQVSGAVDIDQSTPTSVCQERRVLKEADPYFDEKSKTYLLSKFVTEYCCFYQQSAICVYRAKATT